jgi:ATP-dependent Lon protease
MAEPTKPESGEANAQTGRPPLPSDALIILPVRNVVLFPGLVLSLAIERPISVAAAQEAVRSERPLGLVLQTDSAIDESGPDNLHRIGTVAEIVRYITAADGIPHVICRGVRRFWHARRSVGSLGGKNRSLRL